MGKIDRFVNKWVSKKLLVVIIGISGVEWAGIVAIYVAGQSYVDRAKQSTIDPDKEYPKKKIG